MTATVTETTITFEDGTVLEFGKTYRLESDINKTPLLFKPMPKHHPFSRTPIDHIRAVGYLTLPDATPAGDVVSVIEILDFRVDYLQISIVPRDFALHAHGEARVQFADKVPGVEPDEADMLAVGVFKRRFKSKLSAGDRARRNDLAADGTHDIDHQVHDTGFGGLVFVPDRHMAQQVGDSADIEPGQQSCPADGHARRITHRRGQTQ